MKYKFNGKKLKRKYHLVDEQSGLTYCKAENGSWILNTVADSPPPNREGCGICLQLFREGRTPKPGKSNYRGEMVDFYKSDAWARLRYEMLKDAQRCLCCGASRFEARLTVDHVKPIWKYPELKLSKENLQVLCMLCNKGKGGKDETDFRAAEPEPEPVEQGNAELDSEFKAIVSH